MSQLPPELFSQLYPLDDEPPTYIGGRHEHEDQLAESFLPAADELAEAWREKSKPHRELKIALPIIQNYRHAIELGLKAQCFKARELLIKEDALSKEVDLSGLDDLANELGRTHSIETVIVRLNDLMSRLSVDQSSVTLPDKTETTLAYLHDLDAGGMAFRYATEAVAVAVPGSKKQKVWKPVRPAETAIYLQSTITRLQDAATLIIWGMTGFLQEYDDYLNDMYAAHEAEMSEYADYMQPED